MIGAQDFPVMVCLEGINPLSVVSIFPVQHSLMPLLNLGVTKLCFSCPEQRTFLKRQVNCRLVVFRKGFARTLEEPQWILWFRSVPINRFPIDGCPLVTIAYPPR
jgi:hypothetical protein